MTTTDRPRKKERKVGMVEHAASGSIRQWTVGKGEEDEEKVRRKRAESLTRRLMVLLVDKLLPLPSSSAEARV